MKYIYSLFTFSFLWSSVFSQVDILELVPEHQRLASNVKHIKEMYHIDYGDTIETDPLMSKEFWFDTKGRLIREIEYEKFYKSGDTLMSANYYYKDSLLSRRLSFTYPGLDSDSIEEYEIFYKYEYDDNNRLVSYTRGDSSGWYIDYSYNKLNLIDTVSSGWYFDDIKEKPELISIYMYRDDGSLKTIDSYHDNKIESISSYDHSGRELRYKRYTPGNSHTTKYRRFKYNTTGKLKMSFRETVENWKHKNYYTYNPQGLLTSIKAKIVYPRSNYKIDLITESDSGVSKKKIKRKQKSNRETEKRTVVKSHFIYKYNSHNLLFQIQVNKDQRVLRPVVRTFIYEYY